VYVFSDIVVYPYTICQAEKREPGQTRLAPIRVAVKGIAFLPKLNTWVSLISNVHSDTRCCPDFHQAKLKRRTGVLTVTELPHFDRTLLAWHSLFCFTKPPCKGGFVHLNIDGEVGN
jgi:hypothetical protein